MRFGSTVLPFLPPLLSVLTPVSTPPLCPLPGLEKPSKNHAATSPYSLFSLKRPFLSAVLYFPFPLGSLPPAVSSNPSVDLVK